MSKNIKNLQNVVLLSIGGQLSGIARMLPVIEALQLFSCPLCGNYRNSAFYRET